jgi:hypothetical protein
VGQKVLSKPSADSFAVGRRQKGSGPINILAKKREVKNSHVRCLLSAEGKKGEG